MPRSEKQDKAYKNLDDDVRGPWKTSDLSARNFYSKGLFYRNTGGRVIDRPPGGNYWRVSEEKFWDLDRDNRIWWGKDGKAIPQIKRFLSEVKQGVVPQTFWSYEEVGHTQDAKKEVLASQRDVFITPKPERLINRILHIATNPGDLVLDSFLGSGTTAAVAHKMGRRWIGIEMGDHAVTHCQPRLAKVIAGEQGGISAAVGWQGGGAFRFFRLGEAVFDENGQIRGDIDFPALAAHVWFPNVACRGRASGPKAPCWASMPGAGIALLYNGILKDRSVAGGNVLTRGTLGVIRQDLPPGFAGPLLVYGERCLLSPATLEREGSPSADPLRREGARVMLLKDYQARTLETLARFLAEARVVGPAAAYATCTADADAQFRLRAFLSAYRPPNGMEQVPQVCLRLPTGGARPFWPPTVWPSRATTGSNANSRSCSGSCPARPFAARPPKP
jgi:adenine-specific DNA-methyltransferase